MKILGGRKYLVSVVEEEFFLVLRGEEEQRSKQGKMFGKENIWFTEKKKNREGKGEKCLERENREGKVVTCLIYVLEGKVPKCAL